MHWSAAFVQNSHSSLEAAASYLPQKCKMGYEVTTQMTIKALAMATAMSLDG